MDRPLNDAIQQKRSFQRILWILLILGLILSGLYFFRQQLKTSIQSNEFRTTIAEKGKVESTIAAAGEVIPTYEQVLSSPIRASIQEVLKPIGSQVARGERILSLDKSESLLELDRLKDQLELKKNEITRLKFQLDQTLFDLEIEDSIKALNLRRLQAERDDAKRLLDIGGGTQEQLEEATLNLKIAQLEKKKLEHQLQTQRKATETEIREKDLQASIQSNNVKELEWKLEKADIRAQRSGVLTWVNDRIGIPVAGGESLARLADLGHFKIIGSISDIYAEKLKLGLRTLVNINDTLLYGTINNIRPTVENNILSFEVQLDRGNHPILRPNMKVEVYVILDSKTNTLRLANGPAFNGQARQALFIIENGKAIRKEVEIGLSSFEYVEVLSNLQEGETVILSDMEKYKHLSEISIRE